MFVHTYVRFFFLFFITVCSSAWVQVLLVFLQILDLSAEKRNPWTQGKRINSVSINASVESSDVEQIVEIRLQGCNIERIEPTEKLSLFRNVRILDVRDTSWQDQIMPDWAAYLPSKAMSIHEMHFFRFFWVVALTGTIIWLDFLSVPLPPSTPEPTVWRPQILSDPCHLKSLPSLPCPFPSPLTTLICLISMTDWRAPLWRHQYGIMSLNDPKKICQR